MCDEFYLSVCLQFICGSAHLNTLVTKFSAAGICEHANIIKGKMSVWSAQWKSRRRSEKTRGFSYVHVQIREPSLHLENVLECYSTLANISQYCNNVNIDGEMLSRRRTVWGEAAPTGRRFHHALQSRPEYVDQILLLTWCIVNILCILCNLPRDYRCNLAVVLTLALPETLEQVKLMWWLIY